MGLQQQRPRDRHAERLRRLQVDAQLELGRLLDGKLRRLRAREDANDIAAGAAEEIQYVDAVGDEAARLGIDG